MPYLARLGQDAHTTGVPVMRPMVLEFPDDPGAATVDTQYMLGETLLVAPVFTADGDVDVYVPEGTWTSLLTGDRVVGPRWVRERHGFLSLPLYVRPDSVLPVGARSDRPDYAWADGVTLRLVELADGHRSVTRVGDASFVVTREASMVRVEARGTDWPWSVAVAGGPTVTADAGQSVVSVTIGA
jgi:alpha-D-xyloside xylohydrolase